jgi:hypothetical protein
MIVKYTNYKKFSGSIRIGEGGEAEPNDANKPPKPPAKPPTQ